MGPAGWILSSAALCAAVVAQNVRFTEVSEEKGLRGPFALTQEWRPEKNRYWGSTVFDADGDGWYDLLLPNHQQNTEFYWGGPDGFRYENTRTRLSDVHGVGACDWDGDGDEDFIISRGGNRGSSPTLPKLYKTDGENQTFERLPDASIGIQNPVRARSMAFFDMDGDGDRDLLQINRHVPGQKSAHIIYENRGNGRFVARRNIGFQETQAAWFCLADIDNNRWMDIFLFGFTFTELWMGTGTFRFRKQQWRMNNRVIGRVRGCAEIDVDGDGRMEIYMARGDDNQIRDDLLFKVESGRLRDITAGWNLPIGGRHSHVTTIDVDNDGRTDLYVTVMTYYRSPRKRDILLYNTGSSFRRMTLSDTGLHVPYVRNSDGDNSVAFDYNRDGRVDILKGDRNQPWRLYENRTPRNGNNWVRVAVGRPRMGQFNASWDRDPWGALVVLVCDSGKTFTLRTGSPGMSHSASNLTRLTFGIGKCAKIKKTLVYYVGGLRVERNTGSLGSTFRIGLTKCPGRRCGEEDLRACATTCKRNPCEKNILPGRRMFCPVSRGGDDDDDDR